MTNDEVRKQLRSYIDSSFGVVHMVTPETYRALSFLGSVAEEIGWSIQHWTLASNWSHNPKNKKTNKDTETYKFAGTYDPIDPLRDICGTSEKNPFKKK